ncbi:MAG TPA: helix-turn-helix domain-containing protein [Allosphingosinicella sp.]
MSAYILLMPTFSHPRLHDVALSAALHALADPCRLAIVRRLTRGGELSCSAAACHDVPKSTLSNHFKILRAAGLIRTRTAGRDHLSTLRGEEFEARFPGLLATVLAQPDERADAA